MFFLKFSWNLIGRFTENNEIEHDRILCFIFMQEFIIRRNYVRFNGFYR